MLHCWSFVSDLFVIVLDLEWSVFIQLLAVWIRRVREAFIGFAVECWAYEARGEHNQGPMASLSWDWRVCTARLRILTFLESVYVLVMLVRVRSTSMIFSSGVICGCVLVRYVRPWVQGSALLSFSDLSLPYFSISCVLCCCFTLGTEGCCFTPSAYGSTKVLFFCRFCVKHGYFNINSTDRQKIIMMHYVFLTFFVRL